MNDETALERRKGEVACPEEDDYDYDYGLLLLLLSSRVAYPRLNKMEQSAGIVNNETREGSSSCRVVINPTFSIRVCAS